MSVRNFGGRLGQIGLISVLLLPAVSAAGEPVPAAVVAQQLELQQQMGAWLEATLKGIASPYRVHVTVQLSVSGQVRDVVSKEESMPGSEMKMGSRREMKLPGLPMLDKPVTGVGSPDLSFKVPGRTTREVRRELEAVVERTAVRLFAEKGMPAEQLERVKKTALELSGVDLARGDTLEVAELGALPSSAETSWVSREVLMACGTFLLAAALLAFGLSRRSGAVASVSTAGVAAKDEDGGELDPELREMGGQAEGGKLAPEAAARQSARPKAFAMLGDASHSELVEVLKQFGPRPAATIIDLAAIPPEVVRDLVEGMSAERRLSFAVALGSGEVVPLTEVASIEESVQAALVKVRSKVSIGGAAQLADLLAASPEGTQQELLEALGKSAPQLASEVRSKMLLFEDLAKLPVEAIRQVVANVDPGTTALALHGVPEPLRDAVMAAVSKRLKGILAAEAEGLEGKPAAEIETARKTVERTMRRLQGQGRIRARAA